MKLYKWKTPLSINPWKFRALVHVVIKKKKRSLKGSNCRTYHFIKKPYNYRKHQASEFADLSISKIRGKERCLRFKLF